MGNKSGTQQRPAPRDNTSGPTSSTSPSSNNDGTRYFNGSNARSLNSSSSSSSNNLNNSSISTSTRAPAPVPAPAPQQRPSISQQNTNGTVHQPGTINNMGPGAYVMAAKSTEQRYQVTVPNGVRPGTQFQVVVNGTNMMVTCPPNVKPGDRLVLQTPTQTNPSADNQTKYMVQVPQGVTAGMQFTVRINEREVKVTCPPNVEAGQRITFTLPDMPPPEAPNPTMELFEVVVPPKTIPGQPFVLMAGGQKVMVTCPLNVVPGQKIRFNLPKILNESQLNSFRISNDKDGWMRCLGTDFKFRWIYSKSDNEDAAELKEREMESRGFVRVLEPPAGPDMPEFSLAQQGSIRFIPADRYEMNPMYKGLGSVTYTTLTDIARRPFKEKQDWLKTNLNALKIPYEKGHVKIKVYRQSMLLNAMEALSSLNRENLRRTFRFEFIGEPALDAGGVTREFYSLIFEQACNPDVGLFLYSSANQMCVHINANSHITNEHHLRYYHMLGRVMGKAMMDGQITPVHFIQPLYKHLMGWPISLVDLQHLDADVYRSLTNLTDCKEIGELGLDFSLAEDRMGAVETVDLCPGGADKLVDNSNIIEYLNMSVDYRFLKRIQPQLNAFLRGFYDIIPEQLLAVFNFQELELLLHGLPDIDMEDWKKHTDYTGEFSGNSNHQVVRWFWEIVGGYEHESKAKLLQFVTGTSGVPVQGFGFLQGNDGNIRRFTIQGDRNVKVFPRAHTCFNRIDLPIYKTKAEMNKFLTLAITMEATGFDIE